MDPYIKVVTAGLPEEEEIIAFDQLHVSRYLNDGIGENAPERILGIYVEAEESLLNKSRFQWLVNSNHTDNLEVKHKAFLTKMIV